MPWLKRLILSWLAGLAAVGIVAGIVAIAQGRLAILLLPFMPFVSVFVGGFLSWPFLLLAAAAYLTLRTTFEQHPAAFAIAAAALSFGSYYACLRFVGLGAVSGPSNGMNVEGLTVLAPGLIAALAAAMAFYCLSDADAKRDQGD